MKALFLDDVREPPKGWTLARTTADFVQLASRESWDVMSLDHDLGSTGYGRHARDGTWVADWLVRNMGSMPEMVLIHSSNPAGAERMFKILQPHTTVKRVDYSQLRNG